MAGTIGGIAVDIIRGLPQPLKTRVETWVVPGLDGDGAQTLGGGDEGTELISISYIDINFDANTHLASLAALKGTVITIVDDWGDSYPHLLVLDVDTSGAKHPCIKDGSNQVRCEVHFRVKRIAT